MFIRHRAASTRWLGSFLTAKNVTLTWYRLSNITVYSSRTLLSPIYFLPRNSSRLMSKFATGFLGKNPQWKFGFPSIFLALRFDLEFEKEIWESGLSTTFPQQINTAVRNRAKKTVKALLPARGALQDVYMAGKLTHRRQVPRRGKTKWQHRLFNFANLLIKKLLRT